MNIFREAKEVLDKKDAGGLITFEDLEKVNTAAVPLDHLPDMPIGEGLEMFALYVETSPQRVGLKNTGLKASGNTIPLPADIRHGGRVAQLVLWPKKAHKCHRCGDIIELNEPHYTVTWAGAGLGSIKFPDRVHAACVWRHLNITISRQLLLEIWGNLFDYGRANISPLEQKGRMRGLVLCMQRIWKESREVISGSKAE